MHTALGMERMTAMDDAKIKPNAWTYVLAVAILGAGFIGATVLGAVGLTDFVVLMLEIDGMAPQTKVVVPGSAQVRLAESGPYAVYYEPRSMVDGVLYRGSEVPPKVACTLTSEATGTQVAMVPDHVPSVHYSLERGTREGIQLMTTTVDRPGSYTLTCYNVGSRVGHETVLAFGPNLLLEAVPRLLSVVGRFLASLAVMLISVAIAILIVIVVAIARHRSKRLLQAA